MLAWARIELVVCWAGFAYPFLFRAPHGQKRASIVSAGPTLLGLLLECTGISLAWAMRQRSPFGQARIVAGMLMAPVGAALAVWAVEHLGRQFRVQAGLWEDHELIRTGPYAVVRHPIYGALLLMLIATILLYSAWPWWLVALGLYLTGTEVRVRAEDGLLRSRFGAEFDAYQRRVRAYVPFLR